MQYRFSSIIMLIVALLIIACKPTAQLIEISSDTLTYPETITINNCGNKSLSTQSSSRSFTTKIAATGSIKTSYAKIIEGSVSANYEQHRNTTKTHTVTAAPDTNMEFVLIWSDDVRTGNVTANGKSVNYTVNIPVSVEQKSSRDLGCDGQRPQSDSSDASGTKPLQVAFLGKWGSEGDGDGQFHRPWGIGAAQDEVYVGDDGQLSVQIFSPGGQFLGSLPGTIIGNFLDVDSNGIVYALNYDPGTGRNNRVEIYSGQEMTRSFETTEAARGIAVDIYGENIFITDISGQKVWKYSRDGQVLAEWGSNGSGDGEFRDPWGIVMDRYNTKQIYVTDLQNDRVQVFSVDGKFLSKWGTHGTGDGQFDFPVDVAVDTSGNVYVLDQKNARVQVFSPEGKFLGKWGALGHDDGEFLDPYGIAVDLNNNIYVLDSGNYRVQVFRVTITR